MEDRAGVLQVVLATALLVGAVGATLWVASPSDDDPSTAAAVGTDGVVRLSERPAVDHEVEVVADVASGVDLPRRLRTRDDVRVTTGDDRRLRATVPLSEVRGLSDTRGVTGIRIDTSGVDTADPVAPGVSTVGATTLHERGVTGENVTVGVIDEGFRLSSPAVADQVGAYRAFDDPGDGVHGTAVADVVDDTAPDADLHLAAVGPTTNRKEYRAAVRWLRTSGADVVVDAGSYLGSVEGVREVASTAADDVVFVTSTGNYARRHWAGVHRPDGDGSIEVDAADRTTSLTDGGDHGDRLGGATAREWVRFGDDRRNRLGDGTVAGRVTVSVTWTGGGDYDLYLVRQTGAGEVVWTRSTDGDGRREHLSTVVPRGRYAVAVGYDGGTRRPAQLELLASHRLETTTPAGSLTAPATAPGVIAVGAVDDDGDSAAAFSSRGPTADGRVGVDLVAPDTGAGAGGTSFAAPYVAGTVALLQSAYPSVATPRVGAVVVGAASDIGPAGVDPVTGHGRLDAVAAARTLETLVTVGSATPPAP